MDLFNVGVEFILLLCELSLPVAEILLLLLHNLGESPVKLHHLGLELDAVGDVVLLELGGRLSKKHTEGLSSNILLRGTSILHGASCKLNLLHSVASVMLLDGSVDKIQHTVAHHNLPQPDEVAMVRVVHLGNAPGILTAPGLLSITSHDRIVTADNGKRHLRGVEGAKIVVITGSVDLDLVSVDSSSNLEC
jgi:hypothetical protein